MASPAPVIIRMPGTRTDSQYGSSARIVDCQPNPAAVTSMPSTVRFRAPVLGIRRGASFEPRTTLRELGMRASPAVSGL